MLCYSYNTLNFSPLSSEEINFHAGLCGFLSLPPGQGLLGESLRSQPQRGCLLFQFMGKRETGEKTEMGYQTCCPRLGTALGLPQDPSLPSSILPWSLWVLGPGPCALSGTLLCCCGVSHFSSYLNIPG